MMFASSVARPYSMSEPALLCVNIIYSLDVFLLWNNNENILYALKSQRVVSAAHSRRRGGKVLDQFSNSCNKKR